MNTTPSVVLSTGPGRLHLVQSAQHLVRAGVNVTVVQGWVPRRVPPALLNLLGRAIGSPHLAAGLAKRRPTELEGRIRTCAFAESSTHALFLLSRATRGRLSRSQAAAWGWRVFGWQTRRHLRDASIFHVRSGAGQGGAIREARRRGMGVLVDHSIAHPAFMEAQLRSEYERHGAVFDLGPSAPLWRLVLRDCGEADLLLVNSDFVRRTFEDAGYPPERIRVVYLGVRDDFIGLKQEYRPSRPFRLLFTGGFGFRKGAEYLLQAMGIVERRGLDCELTVVGTYAEAGSLLAKYPVRGLRLIGHVPQDRIKEFLAAADLYVFPSLAEGCASAGMEAMAAGLPVLATVESGLPIRDGENGFLVPSKGACALADRIVALHDQPEQLAACGRRAADLIRDRFRWEHYAAGVRMVYDELCRDTK